MIDNCTRINKTLCVYKFNGLGCGLMLCTCNTYATKGFIVELNSTREYLREKRFSKIFPDREDPCCKLITIFSRN